MAEPIFLLLRTKEYFDCLFRIDIIFHIKKRPYQPYVDKYERSLSI